MSLCLFNLNAEHIMQNARLDELQAGIKIARRNNNVRYVDESESESEVTQSCLTLSDPMGCSLPGSSGHGIFPGKSTGVGCHCLLRVKGGAQS